MPGILHNKYARFMTHTILSKQYVYYITDTIVIKNVTGILYIQYLKKIKDIFHIQYLAKECRHLDLTYYYIIITFVGVLWT